MLARFDSQEPPDPWRGRQPKYEAIVRLRPGRFALKTRLPDGTPITVPLGRYEFRRV
jgi:hypothetical protein